MKVIYHSADFDGIFCREIAKRFLPVKREDLIGWNFGQPPVEVNNEEHVYILDLPPEASSRGLACPTIWIDHHKTSIDKHGDEAVGYRIDGVAACRLAWQWFSGVIVKPTKQDFIDRKVSEPLAVCLAGEYDIWDKHDPNADTLQYALRIVEPDFNKLLSDDRAYLENILQAGRVAQIYARNTDASVCTARTFLLSWEGLTFLTVNHARFNSLFFDARDRIETGHDALLGFCWDGKCWTVSLYHANHRKDLDLSEIAKKHGGGGHRGACGFTCKTLPFSLS